MTIESGDNRTRVPGPEFRMRGPKKFERAEAFVLTYALLLRDIFSFRNLSSETRITADYAKRTVSAVTLKGAK